MNTIYERIENLCRQRGIDITAMCREACISRAILSEFKAGRTKRLSTASLQKIADYFGVSVDYLLTGVDSKKAAGKKADGVSEDELKVALFGGAGEVTDAMWQEALNYAQYIAEREKRKKEAADGKALRGSEKKIASS